MAAQESLVKEGVDRLSDAFRSIDDEFQKVQKKVNQRRKTIEKRLKSERRGLEKRTRKEVKRIQGELRKNPVLKRVESFNKDVAKQVEARIDDVLSAFKIASKSDLQRVDRKLNQIGRRLKEVEKDRQSTSSAA